MNEYTRREEVTWTVVTVMILLLAAGGAVARLMTATGPLVPSAKAVATAKAAAAAETQFSAACPQAARSLKRELSLARAKLRSRKSDDSKAIEWSFARLTYRKTKSLLENNCDTVALAHPKEASDADKATAGWTAIGTFRGAADPTTDKEKQELTEKLFGAFEDIDFAILHEHAKKVEAKLGEDSERAQEALSQDQVVAPLAEGLFPRGIAIGVGIGVMMAALIVSYLSVRTASGRRGRTLMSMRRFANTPDAGLQAAAIVRLAAHHNGGEPGMVIGSAMGGLLAALLSPTGNPTVFLGDLFVAGTMGGLLLGIVGQFFVRQVTDTQKWRKRTEELGDIEKPTIPMALLLKGVPDGLEKKFIRYFESMRVSQAAAVVQKLATQTEAQILAAAEANRPYGPQ